MQSIRWLFTRRVALLALGLFGLAATAGAADAPRCRYQRVGALDLSFDGLRPTLAGSINSQPVKMLIDTGATRTAIMQPAAERLGLRLDAGGALVAGFSGLARAYEARVDEISFGSRRWERARIAVVWDDVDLRHDVLVGADFLFQRDLELSLADRQLRFFVPENCGPDAVLAYWDANAFVVEIESSRGPDIRPVVPVRLNGQPLRALIDSGASHSYVDIKAAARVGFRPDAPGVAAVNSTRSIGQHRTELWAARFDSFEIGEERVGNARLLVADFSHGLRQDVNNWATADHLDQQPEMILGVDFLKAHRVLFAMSQRKLYFSYVGGKVFDIPH